jgi:TPP-dependent pyruvate/acetoin dehydrogenase alpha subunit
MNEQTERDLYYRMVLVREFEGRVSALDKQGKLAGGVYSGRGQEAASIGVCHGLRVDDWIFPLHRDMGAVLAKGADPNRLMAQIFGRRDGFSKGKDSYLHGGDLAHGIFGATSMLGSTLPVATGMAYKFRMKNEDRVAVAFFGEGTSSRGDVHEAMNFAGVHKLPVIYVCENNFYAYSTPNELQFAVENVADRAAGYGFKGEVASGNDLHAVLQAMQKATDRARRGEGPTFIELKTYRYHGHSEHDRAAYRTDEELVTWESRDPIELWEHYLDKRKYDLPAIKVETLARAQQVVADAVAFAEASPEPEGPEAMDDLYATPIPGGSPA